MWAARIRRRQPSMFCSRSRMFLFPPQLNEHIMNAQPLLALFVERGLAVLLQRIIFPLPPVLGLDPARFDPTVLLHPVQHRVKHAVGPLQMIVRSRAHLLDDRVTVTLALREQRKNQRFSGGGDEFPWNHGPKIHSSARYVKRQEERGRP